MRCAGENSERISEWHNRRW